MSFDKIELPGSLIASLYKNSLYAMGSEAVEKETVAPGHRPVLGNNNRHTTLVVRFENDAFLPDRHLEFIAKMLGACKMNLGDVAIVNNREGNLHFSELSAQLQPVYLILFGMKPGDIGLPMEFPDFTIQSYNGCHILPIPSLDMVNQDESSAIPLKKKLWACLKQLFPVT